MSGAVLSPEIQGLLGNQLRARSWGLLGNPEIVGHALRTLRTHLAKRKSQPSDLVALAEDIFWGFRMGNCCGSPLTAKGEIEFHLSKRYLLGYAGVKADTRKAADWFEKALKKGFVGHGDCQCLTNQCETLARRFEIGKDAEKSEERSTCWWKKAMEAGSRTGLHKMITAYLVGTGVPENVTLAISLIKQCAQSGDAFGMDSLGRLYAFGLDGPDEHVNKEEGFKWLEKAANLGFDASYYALASCYFHGIGVAVNIPAFFLWIERAARSGYVDAIALIGRAYYNGDIVEKNLQIAAEWFQKASDCASPDLDATYCLACLYWHGEGVRRDRALAIALFEKAERLGHAEAGRVLRSRAVRSYLAQNKTVLWS